MNSRDFLIINWCVFVLVWIVASFSVKRAKERESRASRLLMIGFMAITFMLLGGRITSPTLRIRVVPASESMRIIGDSVTGIGLLTAIWARFSLGRNWSGTVTFKEDHELIQRGPYRWVRHPIYTGLLLMILGTATVIGALGGFLGLAICFAGTWRKLRREEALLTNHFPGVYPTYMARTKALVPFLL